MGVVKYNREWPDGYDALAIELKCIEYGGKWIGKKSGMECGAGLFQHFMNARALIWPDRYRHRWTDLMYKEFLKNDITALVGAASTQKTSHAAEFVLINYWARPEKTCVVVSTITLEKLDTGVFGEIKSLWESGRQRWPWLAGNLIDHKRAIVTDNIQDGKARDMRKGIIGRPCYIGGKWVGLGVLAGTKQEWMFFLCDEIQFMAESFTGSWPNLFSNPHVKIICSGNPKHDPDDQLGIAAEPKEGWNSKGDIQKTDTWDTRFMGGRCINLVGTDSPNFDGPEDQPDLYPKLIGRKFEKRIAHDWGMNSPEYFTQVKGIMRIDMADKRVITRLLCREHFAQEKVVWKGGPRTLIYGLDPSYGGGDLCIGVILEFGTGENGKELVNILEVINVTIDMRLNQAVEDQISDRVAEDCQRLNIPNENVFYDPYGKGTMGFAFARKFGHNSPIPVDSGGQPTERPVRQDLYVDEKGGKKRPKTCREHYSKFVTEAWFSVRYTIEADQLRGLPDDVMLEGCARKYKTVAGNKIEVESKDDYKERAKHSPNKFDALAVAVEGCRQRGFYIAKLGEGVVSSSDSGEWFDKEAKEWDELIENSLLNHTGKKRELSLNIP